MVANTLQVQLEFPRELLGVLNVPEPHLVDRLKQLLVLELFREGYISSGKGAELLGLSKAQFIPLLAQQHLNYFTELPEEVDAEVAEVDQFLRGERV